MMFLHKMWESGDNSGIWYLKKIIFSFHPGHGSILDQKALAICRQTLT